MLSTLSASVSGYFSRPSTSTALPVPAAHEQDDGSVSRAQGQVTAGTDADSPHTPEHHSGRYSPKSLSESGNQTMASVLSAHPHFSVFRKSTSLQSLDQLARRQEQQDSSGGEDDSPSAAPRSLVHSRSFSGHDLRSLEADLVETLATPPNRSPVPRARMSDSPGTRQGGRSSSSEASFHLDSAELPSLNFGDHSSGSLGPSPVASPSLAASAASALAATAGTPVRANASSIGQTSGIRLIPDSPPTTTRTPSRSAFSRFSSADTASSSTSTSTRMRASTTKGPIERVQFSPLGLCASPLLAAPTLPPPPPPPALEATPPARLTDSTAPLVDFDSPSVEAALHTLGRKGSNGILKQPKTPGTGRSVRFSSSTVERTVERWVTPEDGANLYGEYDEQLAGAVGQLDADASLCQLAEDTVSVTAHAIEAETSIALGDSSTLVNYSSASFLSKLQAAIPSPDNSLVAASPPPAEMAELSAITEVDHVAADATVPVEEEQAEEPSLPQPSSLKRPRARLSLLDESNPFLSLQLSALGSETLEQDISAPSSAADASASVETRSPEESTAMTTRDATAEEATLLMHGSLRGSVRAPSFGGDSFVEVSHLNKPSAPATSSSYATRLESVDEDDTSMTDQTLEEQASTRTVHASTSPLVSTAAPRLSGLPTSAGTPSRPSPWSLPNTTPRRPSPLTQEAEFSFVSNESGSISLSQAASATVSLHESDRSVAASLQSVSPSFGTILDESVGSLVEIRPLEPSPPSVSQNDAAFPMQASPAPPTPSQSSSFYRTFMAARAREGLSQSAKEEWDRLERGEKASPKEHGATESEAGDGSLAPEGPSVYWSPQRTFSHDEDEGRSVYVDAGSEGSETSLVEVDPGRATFLSPIAEITEPESDVNSTGDKVRVARASLSRSAPPPQQPSFAGATSASTGCGTVPGTPGKTAVARLPATPRSASKIPRPRNPITPSQNPFLLQLARTTTNSEAGSLLHDLFSTQEDQLAASASQRFLLSSLVTNLQDEVEQKNAMVANLQRQVEMARAEAREIEQLALSWEQRAQQSEGAHGTAPARSSTDAKKLAALEETVRLLADELETRMREDQLRRRDLEKELDRTGADLLRTASEHREALIRLKHITEAQEQANSAMATLRASEETAVRQRQETEREREELRARWRVDAEQRDQVVAHLREELAELRHGRAAAQSDVDMGREVQRQVDLAMQDSARELELAKNDLSQRDTLLAELQEQLRVSRDDTTRLTRAVQEERQHAELANADLEGLLATREQALEKATHEGAALQEELDDVMARLEAVEAERDRVTQSMASKEAEFAQQTEQTQSALTAMAELETAVVRVERDLAAKEAELLQARRELSAQKRESDDVLEKRDRVLAEAEREAGRLRKDLESARGENARLTELVGKLRLDSADREVKVAKLKKRAAELEEDVFGLNIALDAKQQEASHYKRQMSHLKLEKEKANSTPQNELPSTAAKRPANAQATVPSSAISATLGKPAMQRKSHATTPFPSEKASQSRREPGASDFRRLATDLSNASVSHDLTLPPLHSGNEETPSRPAVARSSSRISNPASSTSLGLGLPRAASETLRLRRASEETKENDAPVRRREAVLA